MKANRTKIGGIIQKRELARIGILSIPDRPGVAGTIFAALGAKAINCPFIVHTIDLHGLDSIVLCVHREDLTEAMEVMEAVREDVGAEGIVYDERVAMISVYGPHFGERPGIAGTMFSALGSAGINILAISTSISSLSCLIDAHRIDEAVGVVREAFAAP
jgi:aspartokinase